MAACSRTCWGPGHDYVTYDVQAGVLPADPAECDAYVVTGSAAGVYDDLPWIAPLKAFLVEAGSSRWSGSVSATR